MTVAALNHPKVGLCSHWTSRTSAPHLLFLWVRLLAGGQGTGTPGPPCCWEPHCHPCCTVSCRRLVRSAHSDPQPAPRAPVTSPCPSCVQTQTLAGPHAPSPPSQWALLAGIYESDDIDAIMSEMEKALNYSQKVCPGWGGAGGGSLAPRAATQDATNQTFMPSASQRLRV